MDVQEFKTKYPHLSHLEGNDLWNAMEDAWIVEHKDDKPKVVTDWKGNPLKEGDEFCFVKIMTGGFYKNAGIIFPDGKGGILKEIKFPDPIEEECWEVGEYNKVVKENGQLVYITKAGEWTFHQPISMLEFCSDSKHVLAIKGVSDMKDGSADR